MTDLNKALSEKLAADRYSQRQFAEKIGIDPANLNMVLNGKRNLTLRIARAIYAEYPDLVDVLLK
jgi:transcriptional regulator with XRE-family HTH domain